MSTNSKGEPANPLDKFESYSYQHILMVTNTTNGLRAIQDADKDGTFQTTTFEKISNTKPLPGTNDNNASGVYVICDSRQNSNFSIKSVEYSSYLSGGSPEQSQMLFGSLKMQIFDPNGMTFLNYLQYMEDEILKCDLGDMHFALKTIFVGHTDTGTTEIVTSSFISLSLLSDDAIAVNFDQVGGTYDINFSALSSGAPIGDGRSGRTGHSSTNIKSDANRTLLSAFQSFQNQLNRELKDYYDKLRVVQLPAVGSPDESAVTSNSVANVGKLVQYMFTIPEEWNAWTIDGAAANHQEVNWKIKKAAQSTDTTQQSTENKPKPNIAVGPVSINITPDTTIGAAIQQILSHCDQYLSMAGKDKRISGNNIKMHKTISSFTSDEVTLCLHWDIVEYTVPNIIEDKNSKKPVVESSWDKDKNGNATKPKNSLEFDYFFSGKNDDIIHFDLKVTNAVQLLTNTSMSYDASGKILHNQKNDAKAKDTPEKNNVTFIRKNTPIFMPPKTKDQTQAYSYIAPGSSQSSRVKQEHTASLAEWYANSSLGVKMRIRGNPELMSKTIQRIAPHVTGILTTDAKINTAQLKEYRSFLDDNVKNAQSFENAGITRNIATWPLWIKVNVYTPDVDFDGAPQSNNFAKKFWYDDYYRGELVVHTFSSDGTFTQEITMSANQVNQKSAERNVQK